MALLDILHFPDNRLRRKGEDISTFDDNLKKISVNMLETMYGS